MLSEEQLEVNSTLFEDWTVIKDLGKLLNQGKFGLDRSFHAI